MAITQGAQALPVMWDTGNRRAFMGGDDDIPVVVVDSITGNISAGMTADGWFVVPGPILRVRVTGPATATITGRDKDGNTQVLGSIVGNSADVIYSEFCVCYQVSVPTGTTVEIF